MSKETAPESEPEPEPNPEPEPTDDKEAQALWARLAPHHEASTRKVLDEFFGDFTVAEEKSGESNADGGRGAGSGGAGSGGAPGDRGRDTGSPAKAAAAKAATGQGEVLNDIGAFFFGRRPEQAKK